MSFWIFSFFKTSDPLCPHTWEFIVWDVRFHTILKHFLFNMYLDLVYQLEMLVHDKIRPYALDLHFFDVFWIFHEYFKFGQTQAKSAFKQVSNMKMKNQAWILLSHSKMKLLWVFESFMFHTQNHFSSHMRVHSLRFEISDHIQAYFVDRKSVV